MIDTICILAGGKATRLHPLTLDIPKSLIDINGKPFIIHQLEILKNNNISKIVFCLGYLGDRIEEYLSKSEFARNNFEMTYSYDPEEAPGTGGAIKNAKNLLPETFWIIYGDSYLDINFKEISDSYELSQKSALMVVYKNNNKYDISNVVFRDGLILKYNKIMYTNDMEYIDYGLGILKINAFEKFSDTFDLSDVYSDLIINNQLAGFEVSQRFYEIGSFSGIEELKLFLSKKEKI
jgi:NDP-sugar pyrophosphorylase family protein